MITNKIKKRLKGIKISIINGKSNVRIKDSATTFIRIHKNSIKGKGVLNLNSNAVNSKETSKLRIDEGGTLVINGNVSLFTGFNIHVGKNAILYIDDGTFINEKALISVATKCSIGKNCAISNNVTIIDSNFHIINGKLTSKDINIGDKVLIGANTTILKGSIINDNCVIGAESLVSKEIETNTIAAGKPAVFIKKCIDWK